VGASFFLVRQLIQFHAQVHGVKPQHGASLTSAAGAAAALNFYGVFQTLYTPSYNLLAVVSAALSAAFLVRLGINVRSKRSPVLPALMWGLLLSVSFGNKFSTGTVLLLIEGSLAFLLLRGRASFADTTRILGFATLGFSVNAAVLALSDPDLRLHFARGVEIQLALLPRSPLNEFLTLLVHELPAVAIKSVKAVLPGLVLGGLILVLGAKVGYRHRLGASIAVFVLITLMGASYRWEAGLRIPILTILVVVLYILKGRLLPKPDTTDRFLVPGIVFSLLLFPFACSYGTNNPLFAQMGIAAIFPCALLVVLLFDFVRSQALPKWLYLFLLCAMAALPLQLLSRPWLGSDFTYRLGSSLSEQTVPLSTNPGNINALVDATLARAVRDYLVLLNAGNFSAGSFMLEFTGQSPGLVALAGGRPLGPIWIIGGHNFDGDEAARKALSHVSPDDLRNAWLVSSPDSSTRIQSWRELIEEKLGAFPYEEVGEFQIRDVSSEDKKKQMNIKVWRPI
jgi:hypothetical protein